MSKFVLIGGKNKDSVSNKTESEIIRMSGKERPTILFCPYATINDIEKAKQKFIKMMDKLEYELIVMDQNNMKDFDSLLNKADILYIAGGVSDDLVEIFRKNKLDEILIKYLDTDKIFAGSSAGAMLFTVISMGDKYMYTDNFHNYNYKMVKCLGILNISICPHYQNEDLIIYNDEVRNLPFDSFGIEEDTAIVIDGNKFYCIKENRSSGIYYFKKSDNYRMIPLYEGVIYEKDSDFRS
ncbi:MAG: Type 1 glutamine amidotransferase-like domain-containing protein [Acholeplasmatales bacterium]|nr:Type 1 glutamine amidotransferase-like domain-containing protein [Acholeplasmatales bacterium]